MQTTFRAQLPMTPPHLHVLQVQAEELGRLLRTLFVAKYVQKQEPNALKRSFMADHGMTSRQYNALKVELEGRVRAWVESEQRVVESLQEKIKGVDQQIKNLQKQQASFSNAASKRFRNPKSRPAIALSLHVKQRKRGRLQDRLTVHENRLASSVPSLCFGSRKTFQQQFFLAENGFATHDEWRASWRQARSSQFFALGSKDEKFGCQTVQYDALAQTLTIRLTRKAAALHGSKTVVISGVVFPYGQAQILAAQQAKTAISTRLLIQPVVEKSRTGRKKTSQPSEPTWMVHAHVSLDETLPSLLSTCPKESLGIDLNAHSVAWAHAKSDGNPGATGTVPMHVHGKTAEQSMQIFSQVAHLLVQKAIELGVPLVHERLDFQKKKAQLQKGNARYNAMLSSFAYTHFFTILHRVAARHGVEVHTVNPAYTSVLGWVKFGVDRFSVDEAAAFAIARRALGFSERLRSCSRSPVLRTMLMQEAVKPTRHVWSSWQRFASRLGRSRKEWPGRCAGKAPSAARAGPTSAASKAAGVTPADGGSESLPTSRPHRSGGEPSSMTMFG